MDKKIRLILLFLLLTAISCNTKDSIQGIYYNDQLGNKYTLTVMNNGRFKQTLIQNNDTFTNSGNYSIFSNKLSCTFLKTKEELVKLPIDKGGCAGCELIYKDNKIYNPNDLTPEIFIKQPD